MERAYKEIASKDCLERRSVQKRPTLATPFCSFQRSQKNTAIPHSGETCKISLNGKKSLKLDLRKIAAQNHRILRRSVFKPYLKGLCIRMINFYQKHLSRHTCLYQPTCSEYTKRSINNCGVVVGILLGIWRILRCNPFSRGGYDPAPENYFKVRWLI